MPVRGGRAGPPGPWAPDPGRHPHGHRRTVWRCSCRPRRWRRP